MRGKTSLFFTCVSYDKSLMEYIIMGGKIISVTFQNELFQYVTTLIIYNVCVFCKKNVQGNKQYFCSIFYSLGRLNVLIFKIKFFGIGPFSGICECSRETLFLLWEVCQGDKSSMTIVITL